jgi:5-oxoprolinase (ATP-hydrolysing) subunit C
MTGHAADAATALVEILDPGLLATIQDLGRPGLGGLGIAHGGAADPVALRIANELLGNDPGAAAVEITVGMLHLVVLHRCTLAIAGGAIGGHHETTYRMSDAGPAPAAVTLPAGATITVVADPGLRGYLALPGGIDVPLVLGSRATDLRAGFGGFKGRRLQPGDRLASTSRTPVRHEARWPAPVHDAAAPVRVAPGPHAQDLGAAACDALAATAWTVGPASDRMGLRLLGDPVTRTASGELPSIGVLPGVIQVPPDGRPIVLLPDSQPTGGYPVIGVVAAVDRPRLGQLRPGDELHFSWIDPRDAAAAWREGVQHLANARAIVHEAATWDDLWRSAGG